MENKILKSIIEFYGSIEKPSYKKLKNLTENPYENIIFKLIDDFYVKNYTDSYYDVSFVYSLRGINNNFLLSLSAIGKYGVICTQVGENNLTEIINKEENYNNELKILLELLEEKNIQILFKSDLSKVILENNTENSEFIFDYYHYLISREENRPWLNPS